MDAQKVDGKSTFGALPVLRKHFWSTSGSAEALLMHLRFGISNLGALPVLEKFLRFGGNPFGLVETLLIRRKHFCCDSSTFGALLVQWQHFRHFV